MSFVSTLHLCEEFSRDNWTGRQKLTLDHSPLVTLPEHPSLSSKYMLGFARRRTAAAMPYVAKQPNRRRVVVVGTGWAGATLSTALDERKYKVTMVSPEETTPYTPLLASAACGLYDFR